jgi:excisionase family DNA binding protein
MNYIKSSESFDSEIFNIRIWRVEHVAKFCGWSKGYIYNLVAKEKIPEHKKRGSLFFIPEEIVEWFLQGN